MPSTSTLHIDLDALARNAALLRDAVGPDTRLCAVLKADAYGLGARRIAKRLTNAGASMIALYTPDEARALVDANVDADLLVLMPVRTIARDDRLYRWAQRGRLHLSVHDAQGLEAIARLADGLGLTLPLHVELDTGIGRSGAAERDAALLLARIAEHPRLRLAGLYTHHANAERDADATTEQHARFAAFISAHRPNIPPDCLIHEANTHALLRHTRHRRSMVRVGLGLLGYAHAVEGNTERFALANHARELTPVLSWTSSLTLVRTLRPGATVGYGSTWRARRETRLGVIPVGYADGYPTRLANTGRVGVRIDDPDHPGRTLTAYAPVVGAVSMDQITIDLTAVTEARVGTPVELISPSTDAPNSLTALARDAGTIPYELLCRINPRIERRYAAQASPTNSPDPTHQRTRAASYA
jgi:alanine racemase